MDTQYTAPDAQDPLRDNSQGNSPDLRDLLQDTQDPSFDTLFKFLFKHKAAMASLLRCVGIKIGIPEPWMEAMVPDTLQPFPTEHITESLDPNNPLRAYFSDSTWIVVIRAEYLDKTDGATRYFAFAHECQSALDPTMPMRIEVYSSSLQGDLRHAGLTPRGEATIVISILTNIGDSPWTVPTDTADLYPVVGGVPADEELGSKRHYLVDLCSMNCDDLPQEELFTCLIRLRSAEDWWQAWEIFGEACQLAPDSEERGIRLVFYHLARKMVNAPEGFKIPEFKEFEDLMQQGGNNVTTFLDHTRDVCHAKVDAERAAIRTKARTEGLTEGHAKGLTEGRREGITQGRVIGREEGLSNQRSMLRHLAAKCFDAKTAEQVAEFVRAVEDPNQLTKVAELIVECDTGEELLERLT